MKKEVFIFQPDENTINETELKKRDLTNREYEVLQAITKGYNSRHSRPIIPFGKYGKNPYF